MKANPLALRSTSVRLGASRSAGEGRSLYSATWRPAAFFDRELSTTARILGWLVATGLFVAGVILWYSPNVPDAYESVAPTVAIVHGSPQCAYASSLASSVPPLYPVIAAGVMEVTRLGTGDVASLLYQEAHCDPNHFRPAGGRHYSATPVLLIGLLGWPVLLGGFVALLRAAGRSRRRWELLGACLIACIPAVTDTLVEYFHPEDLFAMGLILAALAAAVRSRWLASGVCIGLACCFKQYPLLAFVPLLVAAPRGQRRRFLQAGASVVAVVVVPSAILLGRGALEAWAGFHATPPGNFTVVSHLHLQGVALAAASRALPLWLALAIALWAKSRLGAALCRAQPLVALVATCLALRLVFEVNLFGYYFMATAVALLALDVVMGRLRLVTICWIAVTTVFFPPSFERFVYTGERYWVITHPGLALVGLALAAVPLYGMCAAPPPPPDGADPVSVGDAANSPVSSSA
jgi:hypothetical protein